MPYINIRVTPPGLTRDQKEEVIRRVTQVMVDVLDKPADGTFVVIDELPSDNWGVGGKSVTTRREKASG
jgi:4-oxalocrotonate tautomerase